MSVSTEMLEFIKACVTSDPKKRSSVRDLLKNTFIKQHEQDRLDKTPLEDTNLDADGISLLKFQVATVINQAMFRAKIINKQKKDKLAEFLNPSMKAGHDEQKKTFKDIVHEIKSIDLFEKRRIFEA